MWGVGSVTFRFFESVSFKEQLKELGVYTLEENEMIINQFKNGKRNYALSIIPDRRTNDLNVLLKNKKKYYLLKNVPSCKILDSRDNIFIMDNKIYVHCDGATGVILQYQVTDGFIGEKEYAFNFDDTPNSDTHALMFDKVDEKNMYLKTNKIDMSVEEGEKLKCSFKSNKCKYYVEETSNKKKTSKKK